MANRSISTLTNPTGLREIARSHVAIAVQIIDGRKHFEVVRLDLSTYNLASDLVLIVVADAGNTRVRTEIGTVAAWLPGPHPLDGLDASAILRFRILVRRPSDPTLVATAERIRPASEGDAESLIAIETAHLGQLLWRVNITEYEAVIQCNINVFPTTASALDNVAFNTLVLPEALRQVLRALASNPERLDSDEGDWPNWMRWLRPMGFDELPDSSSDESITKWVDEVIDAFCNKYRFADQMLASTQEGAVR